MKSETRKNKSKDFKKKNKRAFEVLVLLKEDDGGAMDVKLFQKYMRNSFNCSRSDS
jgi:hypothetical protein